MLLPSLWVYRTIHFTSCVNNNPIDSVWEASGRHSIWWSRWSRLIGWEKCKKNQYTTYKASHMWEASPQDYEMLRWRHGTQSVGSSQYPKGPVSCHFPQLQAQGRKMTHVKAFCSFWSMCALLVMFSVFRKIIFFRHFKGETGEWMQRNEMDLQTRAGNQIITLTSNFGIKYFGYTILSLWFWLFNTKHPVLKGRLVVGLFICFSI